MKKGILLFVFLISQIGFTATFQDNLLPIETDSIVINKNTNIENKLEYTSNLKNKYNDNDFKYNDNIKAEKSEVSKPESTNSNGSDFLSVFLDFMTYVFPYILGIIIVLIIIKSFLGSNIGFWNLKTSERKVADKLIYEDEDIHDTNFSSRIDHAISNQDYRLATRYYYLSLLKLLSDKKAINYHKDKTNTEYLFEIKNKPLRDQFSNVSYIYSYVWYGEFPIDALEFKTIEKKYKFIFKSIN